MEEVQLLSVYTVYVFVSFVFMLMLKSKRLSTKFSTASVNILKDEFRNSKSKCVPMSETENESSALLSGSFNGVTEESHSEDNTSNRNLSESSADSDDLPYPYVVQKTASYGKRNSPKDSGEESWFTDHSTRSSTPSEAGSSSKLSRRQKKNRRKATTQKKTKTTGSDPPDKSPRGVNFFKQIKRLKVCEKDLHELFMPLCLNAKQRILNGYPYETRNGVFVLKRHGLSGFDSAWVDAEVDELNVQGEYRKMYYTNFDGQRVPAYEYEVGGFELKFCQLYQKCTRCYQQFDTYLNGSTTLCLYHPMKPVLTSDGDIRYQCCNLLKSDGGCCVRYYHVYHQLSSGHNGPLSGFVSTEPAQRSPKLYGIDCEMVYTTLGFEVARATLVNIKGVPVLDVYIHPIGSIIDLNTQFSGITFENLKKAIPFAKARKLILDQVQSNDILVGHSLECDLEVLKILHRRVVDTSNLFLISGGLKQSLKSLAKEHLGEDIQQKIFGHDSAEDAKAALHLALSKISSQSWRSLKPKPKEIAPLPAVLMAYMN